jgi:hypothetical protein
LIDQLVDLSCTYYRKLVLTTLSPPLQIRIKIEPLYNCKDNTQFFWNPLGDADQVYEIQGLIPGGDLSTIKITSFDLDANFCTNVYTLVHETDDNLVLGVVAPAYTQVISNYLYFKNIQTSTRFIHKFRIKASITPVNGNPSSVKFSPVQQITLCSPYINLVQALTLTNPLVFSSLDGATNF